MVHVIVHSYTHRANLGVIIFSLYFSPLGEHHPTILYGAQARHRRKGKSWYGRGSCFSGLLVAAWLTTDYGGMLQRRPETTYLKTSLCCTCATDFER